MATSPFIKQSSLHKDSYVQPPCYYFLTGPKKIRPLLEEKLLEQGVDEAEFSQYNQLLIGTKDGIHDRETHVLIYRFEDIKPLTLTFDKKIFLPDYISRRHHHVKSTAHKTRPVVRKDGLGKFKVQINALEKGFLAYYSKKGLAQILDYSLSWDEQNFSKVNFFACYAGSPKDLRFLYFPVKE